MQFNSYSFLLLLIPAAGLFWALPAASRRWYVLALSVAYYATWNPVLTAVPMVLCLGVHFMAHRLTLQPNQARRWLWGGVAFILTIFLFFQCREFLLANVNAALSAFHAAPLTTTLRIAIPVGISFYSFEAIGYLIDSKQGRIKNVRLWDLYFFLTFFPTVVSGPILRFRELAPQLGFTRTFELPMLLSGIDRLVWGLVQKNLIANTLAGWVNEGFLPNAVRGNTSLDNWAMAVAFGLQIYFDFAAYSNMAIGIARIIGVTLPENFRFPYHAQTPPDFWNRWHMTLSRWIRDYLFFPVNARFRGAHVPLYLSLLGIMALVGLWHGAGWGFVTWGALHGAYLVLYRIWENFSQTRPSRFYKSWAAAWLWRVFTLAAVTVAWVPFRADTGSEAAHMLLSMLGRFRFGFSYTANFYLVVLLLVIFCAVEPFLAAAWNRAETALLTRRHGFAVSAYVLRPAIYATGLLLFLIFDDRSMQFIYFRF